MLLRYIPKKLSVQTLLSFQGNTTSHPQFPGLVLSSGQKVTLGPLATITLEIVPFRASAFYK
jgi:hypothetical protein